MAEISINDYVRTPNQGIFIISHINKIFEDDDKNKVCLCQNSKVAFVSINTIKQLKHSKNIIDLIKKGDYINGYKVCEINKKRIVFEGCHKSKSYYYFEDNDFEIKSIITKEQIKQIEYRIKE